MQAGKKLLKQTQQANWALGKAGVILGAWDVGSPQKHVLFPTKKHIWLPALNTAKAKGWPALVQTSD